MNKILTFIILIAVMVSGSQSFAGPNDLTDTVEAYAIARTDFLKRYPQRDGTFIARKIRNAMWGGLTDDGSLYQFQRVYPVIQDSSNQKATGEEWRGAIIWKARSYRRWVDTRVPGLSDQGNIKLDDWRTDTNDGLLTVKLVKRNGKWEYQKEDPMEARFNGPAFQTPTAQELQDVAKVLKLPNQGSDNSMKSLQALLKDATLHYLDHLDDPAELFPLCPPAKVLAAGDSKNIAKAFRLDHPGFNGALVTGMKTAVLDDPSCAVGIVRLTEPHAEGQPAKSFILLAYTNTGGFQWWFAGTSSNEQAFLRAASLGKLKDNPIVLQDGDKWTLARTHEVLDISPERAPENKVADQRTPDDEAKGLFAADFAAYKDTWIMKGDNGTWHFFVQVKGVRGQVLSGEDRQESVVPNLKVFAPGPLTAADKLNGISWRGMFVWGAEAFRTINVKEGDDGRPVFDVKPWENQEGPCLFYGAQQVNGKWELHQSSSAPYQAAKTLRPSEAEMSTLADLLK